MVSNMVVAAMAAGAFHISRYLPSPFREIFLVCICLVAFGFHHVAQYAAKEPGSGPELRKGWSFEVCTEGGSLTKKCLEGERAADILCYNGDSLPKDESGVAIVVIPGNPGLPHFYCSFGEHLQTALAASGVALAGVYSVGYPIFSTAPGTNTEGTGMETLETQTVIISKALTALEKRHNGKIIVIGHSLGAWVALRHYATGQAHNQESSPLLILAMPYLEFSSDSWLQCLYSKLVHLPGIDQLVRALSLVVMAVPSRARPLILKLFASLPQDLVGVSIATFFEQSHHVASVVKLLRSELAHLRAGMCLFEEFLSTARRPPLLAMYTLKDSWAPPEHASKLKALCSNDDDTVIIGETEAAGTSPPPHSFVCDDQHCRRFAKMVSEKIAHRIQQSVAD